MVAIVIILAISISGCSSAKIRLFPSQADPLKEYALEGEGKEKILVIPVRGAISDAPREGMIRTKPSLVQEVVSQLRLAEEDDKVKAVILKIDSPGGSVTASDILYNEIAGYKKRTNAKVVAAMMGVAASGAYYIALPADFIQAHPQVIEAYLGETSTID